MEYAFGITLISVVFSVRESEAGVLPNAGLLNAMPVNCTDVSYCTVKHAEYPQEVIDLLLTEKYRLQLAEATKPPAEREEVHGFNDNCERVITYTPIYEITDELGNVRVVVQSKIFKQTIRIERCLYPGRQTRVEEIDLFASEELQDYNISCVEKTVNYNFLVLTRDGKGLESARSNHGIPVCCSCRVDNYI